MKSTVSKKSPTKPIKEKENCGATIKAGCEADIVQECKTKPYHFPCGKFTSCREVKAGCGHVAHICTRCFNAGRIVKQCWMCYDPYGERKDIVENIEHK
jgi:hypothetical protein